MSKGSRYRPIGDRAWFDSEFDRIFGNGKKTEANQEAGPSTAGEEDISPAQAQALDSDEPQTTGQVEDK